MAGCAGHSYLIHILDKQRWCTEPHLLPSPAYQCRTEQNTYYAKQKQAVLTEDGKPGGTFRTFFVCTSMALL